MHFVSIIWYFSFFLLLTQPFLLSGQQLNEIQRKGNYLRKYEITFTPGVLTHFTFPFSFNSVSFESMSSKALGNSFFIINEADTIFIEVNDEAFPDNRQVSGLYTFDLPVNSFYFQSESKNSKVNVYLVNSVPVFLPKRRLTGTLDMEAIDCTKPEMIPQDDWRLGLAPPTTSPVFTPTEHVVLHHTASQNSINNYWQEIRNIYIYHTITLGWDDIGYNFLIAPDGTIFEGRDGHGEIEEDFVKGAHFCGKNSYTMGVSFIGNLNETSPTTESRIALLKLLSWKFYKDQLNPFDSSIHPKSSGNYLAAICGHKDGCATDCPGDSLYLIISEIRNTLSEILHRCKTSPVRELVVYPDVMYIYASSAGLSVYVRQKENSPLVLTMTDLSGKLLQNLEFSGNPGQIYIPAPGKGVYILRMVSGRQVQTKKIIITD